MKPSLQLSIWKDVCFHKLFRYHKVNLEVWIFHNIWLTLWAFTPKQSVGFLFQRSPSPSKESPPLPPPVKSDKPPPVPYSQVKPTSTVTNGARMGIQEDKPPSEDEDDTDDIYDDAFSVCKIIHTYTEYLQYQKCLIPFDQLLLFAHCFCFQTFSFEGFMVMKYFLV